MLCLCVMIQPGSGGLHGEVWDAWQEQGVSSGCVALFLDFLACNRCEDQVRSLGPPWSHLILRVRAVSPARVGFLEFLISQVIYT